MDAISLLFIGLILLISTFWLTAWQVRVQVAWRNTESRRPPTFVREANVNKPGNRTSPEAAAPGISKVQMQKIRATSQYKLEAIFRDINSIWKLSQQFIGTYRLHNPFSDAESWTANAQRRYREAEKFVGLQNLIVVMHSDEFVRTVISDDNDQNEAIYQVLLHKIRDNKSCIWMFAITRGSRWFDQYNNGWHQAWMKSLDRQVNCWCPSSKHPHELYRALDGSIRRNIFTDSFSKTHAMNNIKENIYYPPHWVDHGPRPADWPRVSDWPSDPSVCTPCVNSKYPKCRGCNDWTGPMSTCRCLPEQIYTNPLVEIKQYLNEVGFNRGVRVLEKILKGQLIGEYVGELIPVSQNARPPFGDEKYHMVWLPQPKLNAMGRRAAHQPRSVRAIATLISGRNGNWTRFIAHKDQGSNVAARPLAIGGKMRIVVYALRDIEFGEEVTMDYYSIGSGRTASRRRGGARLFNVALSVIREDGE